MYLGIDLGTSGLRALLTDDTGTPVASAEAQYDVQTPHPGWSEQDPGTWIAALDQAMAQLQGSPGYSDIRGIAVAGHMHGAVLLDGADQVLRPCILWNDTRSAAEAAELDATAQIRDLSGNIVFPGFTAPKLLWVQRHEPEIFAKTAKVLLPAAYLNLHLTGRHVADMSDSAGTSWLDVGARDWSEHLLSAGQMRRDQMPDLVEGCAAAGTLRPELAARWGLTGPITISGGAGDNAAAACGTGVMAGGQGFVSLGTSGVVLAARNGFHPDPATAVHTFCHAIPERWYQMGVMLSATDCMNWLGRITGRSPADLTADLGDQLRQPGEVTFLPYLSGERTPHNSATLRGGFEGLSIATTAEDLAIAVMEGVSYGLRDCLEALRETGAEINNCLVIGGGSKSAYWVKLLATILDLPLQVPKDGEFGAALGAARLARLAVTGEDPAEVLTAPERAMTVTPDPQLRDSYEAGYAAFRKSAAELTLR
ncbi:xylulokinase [Phaeobacter gallaeciensis]|uniref:xylulokinase n=1 Tax=Phaeobacter gallaeciensis TaxID=60890 RepID=UPI000BBC2126|nr:xylulokinase [Phaeobacter gallaeciensis]ATF18547.1 D-xylulose kinase [Phaeobacter gallaeciensis]ATF22656.1 D-xylulose kinase [Phaeobacter gallaeciensis]